MSKTSSPQAARYGSRVRACLEAFAFGFVAIGILLAAGHASTAKPALSSSLSIERPIITRGWTRPVYVLVHFSAPELDVRPNERPPLNLSLVLDRSGSMEDRGKIEYLRQAAKLAVGKLAERDVISVVEFDDRITLMWPAAHAHDIRELQDQIDQLTPRGSTNLAGGMERGIEEAQQARHDMHLSGETLSRVIVLTDGLANTGVTNPGDIAEMAANARRGGVRVSTIGLGADYNEDLLQSVAEGGGGKYYFVESPVQLARIFEEELHSAFATSARDVHIAFHGGSAVRDVEMIGFARSSGRDVSADWPDFYAGEDRTVLLRLDVSADRDGSLDLGHFDVAWHDARNGASGTLDLPIRVSVTDDMAASDRSLNKDVSVEASLAESERNLAANVKLAASGHADDAKKANAAIIADLKARNGVLKDERITRKLEAMQVEQDEITNAAAAPSPEAMQNYAKASKQRLYQAKTGNRAGYVLQKGDKGIAVERLQQALASAGVYKGKVTGLYDQPTADAVLAYQKKNGVNPDGVAGASTQMKLGLY
ncbi:MAG TPA: VWA domain-containing protein [Rhizomicrobium sp.]|nr:VWA domain-containing protein [Rhizomicrobium sp.]